MDRSAFNRSVQTFYRRFIRLRLPRANSRPQILSIAAAMVCALVSLEWYFNFDFSLGVLYIIPVMIAATILSRWQIVFAAILCAYTRGLFTAEETQLEHTLRFCMATIAYTGCGLLIYQIADSRRVVLKHYSRLRYEQNMRRRAQEQLRLLAERSPAAILTVDSEGRILASNHAAENMFQPVTALTGQMIGRYMPVFQDALQLPAGIGEISTSATAWARRDDGTMVPTTTWFSVYGEGHSRHLAAILVDNSNEVREREYAQFEQIASHDRILASAVSHEIRNLCSAIFVVASNMGRNKAISADPDFAALKNLAAGLRDLASVDLRKRTRTALTHVSLYELSEELRVIASQDWSDIGGELEWKVPHGIPAVLATRQGLMQTMLNLSQNALRAVEDSEVRRLVIETSLHDGDVALRVCDTGHGLKTDKNLFQPFREEADGSGLGLYVSRALIESFGGHLRYEPTDSGCCFVITLRAAQNGGTQPALDNGTEAEETHA
jgi:signal transduction histidine kinase